jgi:GDP-4-dehydro-6-deoxy-D-mannose reductase
MATRALVTGIGGFVAGHLARLLLDRGVSVAGTHRPHRPPAGLPAAVRLLSADLEEPDTMAAALRAARPEWLFHLAGVSSEGEARQDPERALTVNLLGTLHLFDACRRLDPPPRVLVAGSAAEYGLVREEENPVREEQPLRPATPYGMSKAAQGLLAFQYATAGDLAVIHARAFNHTGPGQTDAYAASSFARQIAEAEAGLRPPEIEVGNLSARRDLSDVRDVARAYVALMETGTPGQPYNVGSGQPVSMQEVLDTLLALARTPIRAVPSPARLRPLDVPLLQADTTRLRAATGWQPQIPLPQTLADLLQSWRARLASTQGEPAPGS